MKMYCINHIFTEFLNSACENSATAVFSTYDFLLCLPNFSSVTNAIELEFIVMTYHYNLTESDFPTKGSLLSNIEISNNEQHSILNMFL